MKGGQGGHFRQWHCQEMSRPVRSSMCLWLRLLIDEAGETIRSQTTMVLAASVASLQFTLLHFVFKCLCLPRLQVRRDVICVIHRGLVLFQRRMRYEGQRHRQREMFNKLLE